MVWKVKCDCYERIGTEINAIRLFEELESFFNNQIEKGIFVDVPVEKPFFIGQGNGTEIKWYASKWYKCKECGCLWEFEYPDFPAKGFVRKLEGGIYYKKE